MAAKSTRTESRAKNRQLILQHIHAGIADSRAALAHATGLTKPTVGDIVSTLIDEGLLVEAGRGKSTESGGKRPRLLEFLPSARQVIGVSIQRDRIIGALADLNGEPLVHHELPLRDVTGEDPLDLLETVINGLAAQLTSELLCIGISTPGVVDTSGGVVRVARRFGWKELPLAAYFARIYAVPVYVGNDTELATRARLAMQAAEDVRNIVTVIIEDRIEVGFAFAGRAYHHSDDLGKLQLASDDSHGWIDRLGWAALQLQATRLRGNYPQSQLPADWDTIDLLYGLHMGDALCARLYDDIAANLGRVFAWIVGLLRPDEIVLAGAMADLGTALIDRVEAHTRHLLPSGLVDNVAFSVETDATLSLNGALVLSLQNELGILR
ncbi:MAG: ROK family protein [Chloroflexota bacterium]